MSQEERLLVVTESLGVGGTESHLMRLLPELAKRGWDIAAFCLTDRGARAGSLEAAGVEVFSPEPGAKFAGVVRRAWAGHRGAPQLSQSR